MRTLIVLRDTEHYDVLRTAYGNTDIGGYFQTTTGITYDIIVAAPVNWLERQYIGQIQQTLLNPKGRLILM